MMLNNPELLAQNLEKTIQDIKPPQLIKKNDWGEGTTITLYEDKAISVERTDCFGITSLTLTIPADTQRKKNILA